MESLSGARQCRLLASLACALLATATRADATSSNVAGAPIPVHFASGSSFADVSGKISEHGAIVYSLVAGAGQTMAIELHTGYTSPMAVSVPGGIFRMDVSRLQSSQYWTGTILKTGTVDIAIRGNGPIPNNPDPNPGNYSMHVLILGGAPAHVDRIEQVDFANGTIALGAGSANQLKAGKLAPPYDEAPYYDKEMGIEMSKPVFGNIDGYAGELAAVFIVSGDGGTGEFGVVDLFALKDGLPMFVAILPGGDRAEGGFEKAWIEGGRLNVDVLGSPPGGPACCPTFIDTVRYRFVGSKLVRDAKASRRKYDS